MGLPGSSILPSILLFLCVDVYKEILHSQVFVPGTCPVLQWHTLSGRKNYIDCDSAFVYIAHSQAPGDWQLNAPAQQQSSFWMVRGVASAAAAQSCGVVFRGSQFKHAHTMQLWGVQEEQTCSRQHLGTHFQCSIWEIFNLH